MDGHDKHNVKSPSSGRDSNPKSPEKETGVPLHCDVQHLRKQSKLQVPPPPISLNFIVTAEGGTVPIKCVIHNTKATHNPNEWSLIPAK
jgi:hypothetical protein